MADTNYQGIDETLREKFESDWLQGEPQPIENYLPDRADTRYEPTLEELVHIDMEFSWKRAQQGSDAGAAAVSEPILVEDYVARFPTLAERGVLLRLVQQEYLLRHQFGDRPGTHEYQQRFPAVITDNEAIETLVRQQGHGDTASALRSGQSLDRYRLLNVHGRGAFGNVWRAEDERLSRTIAVKELNSRLATTRELRFRFEREAKIAARLEHPGIVPVYDVGSLEGEHPYYTMKLVRGKTLADEIARCHALEDGPERNVQKQKLLSSFVSVCHTMEYAHARGVVHRDLKPQNIVVGEFGETILLDWGLAKGPGNDTDAEPADEGSIGSDDVFSTQAGQIKGTPAYMSPEQARGDVGAIDEQSDVYGLGAILHQVLTGQLPVGGDTAEQVLENVRSGKITRPRTIDGEISRSLESICLAALSTDKSDRYDEVANLTADIENFLADEPVSVHRESIATRSFRWMRRHRSLVTGTVATIVVALAGLLIGLVLVNNAYQLERVARQNADEQRQRAENNLEVALQSVDTFLVRFTDDQRLKVFGMQQLRQDMLEEAEQFYNQLAQQEGDDLQLLLQKTHALNQAATINSELGNVDKGIEKLEAAMAITSRILEDDPSNETVLLEQAHLQNAIGNLHELKGELILAVEFQNAAVTTFGNLLDGDHRAEALEGLFTTQGNMAVAMENQGQYREAEQQYREVIEELEPLVEQVPDDARAQRLLSTQLMNLGVLLIKITPPNQLDPAIAALEQAIEHSRESSRLRSHDVESQAHLASLYSNLALAFRKMMVRDPAFLDRAEEAYDDALEIQQTLVADAPEVLDHFHKLAVTYGNMSTVHFMRGDYASAEKSIRESIDIRESAPLGGTTVPRYHYALAGDYFTLMNTLKSQNRLEESDAELDKAAAIMEPLSALYPESVPFLTLLAKVYHARAHIDFLQDDFREAIANLDRSIALTDDLMGKTPNDVQLQFILRSALELRGESRLRSGDNAGANDDWDRLLDVAGAEELARLRFSRAKLNVEFGDYKEAVVLGDQMLELARQDRDDKPALVFFAVRIYAMAAQAASEDESLEPGRRIDRTAELLDKAMDLLKPLPTENPSAFQFVFGFLNNSPEMKLLRTHPEFDEFMKQGKGDEDF
ncbi:MAG: protein kinase domain-containing protein [Pirellulaceae bacterium]